MSKLYPTVAKEERAETIAADLRFRRNLLAKQERIDLTDYQAVVERTDQYLADCEESAIVPTFIGLATAFGMSRQALYKFLDTHATSKTADYLEMVRDVLADSLVAAGLTRGTDSACTIFILKNLHEFTDRVQLEPPKPESPLGVTLTAEEIAEKYKDLPEE